MIFLDDNSKTYSYRKHINVLTGDLILINELLDICTLGNTISQKNAFVNLSFNKMYVAKNR